MWWGGHPGQQGLRAHVGGLFKGSCPRSSQSYTKVGEGLDRQAGEWVGMQVLRTPSRSQRYSRGKSRGPLGLALVTCYCLTNLVAHSSTFPCLGVCGSGLWAQLTGPSALSRLQSSGPPDCVLPGA